MRVYTCPFSLEPLLVYVCCVCIVMLVCVLIAHSTDNHANPIKEEALNGITLYKCFVLLWCQHYTDEGH